LTDELRPRSAHLSPATVKPDAAWSALRAFTAARIGLPRSGASLATGPLLELRLAHARARDAVHHPLDPVGLAAALRELGLPVLAVASAAPDRRVYLMRPDLGRRLAPEAQAALAVHAGGFDVAFVVADGLSAQAVESHARPALEAALSSLRAEGWRIAPLVVVSQGRVAVGDAVAAALGADCVAVLIGERPGLSSPDSMGAYLTFRPGPGTTDADRNCISNIQPKGFGPAEAGSKIAFMLREMRARGLSGVKLKDKSPLLAIAPSQS